MAEAAALAVAASALGTAAASAVTAPAIVENKLSAQAKSNADMMGLNARIDHELKIIRDERFVGIDLEHCLSAILATLKDIAGRTRGTIRRFWLSKTISERTRRLADGVKRLEACVASQRSPDAGDPAERSRERIVDLEKRIRLYLHVSPSHATPQAAAPDTKKRRRTSASRGSAKGLTTSTADTGTVNPLHKALRLSDV